MRTFLRRWIWPPLKFIVGLVIVNAVLYGVFAGAVAVSRRLPYLAGLLLGTAVVLAVVRSLNRRGDPRSQPRPPEPP